MIKKLFAIVLFVLVGKISFSQTLISINPNQAAPNQTLTTTVSSAGFYFTMSSQPTNQGNLYFDQGGLRIYPNWVTVTDDDHFDVNWTIPLNVPYGLYDLVYEYFQWGWPFPNPVTAILPGAFTVLDTCNIAALPVNGTVCQNDSVKLSSATATSYLWYKNNVPIPGATGKNYYAKTSGSYTVVRTGTICASPSAPFIVTINPLPTSTITPNNTQQICTGQTVTFQANTGIGVTYNWKKNGNYISGANASSLTVQDSGYYKCIVTNSNNGCSKASAETRVKVTALPLVTITLQPGSANGIDAEVNTYSPTLNYGNTDAVNAVAWTINGTPIKTRSFFQFDLSAIPPGSTIYSASLNLYFDSTTTSANHTLYGDNKAYIQRVTAPWSENTITWNNQPATTTLNQVSVPASSLPIQDFKNIDIAGLVKLMVDSPTVNYGFMLRLITEVQYRSLLFCSSDFNVSARRPKLVIKYSGAGITTSSGSTFCNGDSTILNTANGTYTYQWKKNGNAISGATAAKYTAKTSGTYTVKITNSLGCSVTSQGKIITVNTLPSSTITPDGPTTFCNGDSVVLKGIYSNTNSFQWKKNNGSINGATAWKYTAKTSGNYTVKVTNSNGCTKVSSSVNVSVPCKDGESNLLENNFYAEAYPNPSSGEFNFRINNSTAEVTCIRIYDLTGRMIKQLEIKNSVGEIPVSIANPGMYKAEIIQGKNIKVISLVKTE